MRPHGPQENDLHLEILQVTLGIVFSRRLHPALRYLIQPLGIPSKNTRYSAYTRKGNLVFGTTTTTFSPYSFFSFFSVDRDIFTPSLQSRSEVLEICCLDPPGVDMAWIRSGRSSSSMINLFSALEALRGWKLLFFFF